MKIENQYARRERLAREKGIVQVSGKVNYYRDREWMAYALNIHLRAYKGASIDDKINNRHIMAFTHYKMLGYSTESIILMKSRSMVGEFNHGLRQKDRRRMLNDEALGL